MRLIRFLLIGFLFVSTTACFDVIEELSLQKDGSGTYRMTLDLSDVVMGFGGMGALPMAALGGDGEEVPDQLDSVLHFRDFDGLAAIELTPTEEAMLEKVDIRMHVDKSAKEAEVTFMFPFQEIEEVNQMNALWRDLEARSESDSANELNPFGMLGGFGGLLEVNSRFGLDGKRTLTRSVQRLEKNTETEAVTPTVEGLDDLVDPFLKNIRMRTIYRFPKKVRSHNLPGARIDGATLTMRYTAKELLAGKANLEGYIKFK